MKDSILSKIPKELKPLIKGIKAQGISQGLKVYLVGGFVRDLLLGVKNLDLDIVIEGDGIGFAQNFYKFLKGKRIVRHKSFGTATVFLGNGFKIDFSSARKEFYPKPGHLPVVSRGTLRDDLLRRDFTINAMAVDLDNGAIIDFFGGQADIKKKEIRVLHDLSFQDDPLRILRAVRFEKRYDFRLEPRTLKLLKESCRKKMLEKVHPHRLRDDLVLILKEPYPVKSIKRLNMLAGFSFVHPKLKVSPKVLRFLSDLEKEKRWFRINFPQRRELDFWLVYLIGLVLPLSVKETQSVCSRFGLRRGEQKRIVSFKDFSPLLTIELSRRSIKPSKIFDILEPLSYETIISLRARNKNNILRKNISDFLEIYNGMSLFISGKDLHSFGLRPGPLYQNMFAQVLTAKLDGKVRSRREELLFIKDILNKRSFSNVQTG